MKNGNEEVSCVLFGSCGVIKGQVTEWQKEKDLSLKRTSMNLQMCLLLPPNGLSMKSEPSGFVTVPAPVPLSVTGSLWRTLRKIGVFLCQILIYIPVPFNHTADAPVQTELSNLHSSHAVPHSPAHNTQLHSVASQTDCEALKNSCCKCSALRGWDSIWNAGKFASWWPGCVSPAPSAVSIAEQGPWVNPEGGTKCVKERASAKLQFYGLWCK